MSSVLRSWAERLTRPLSYKRRLPSPFRTEIYVTPAAMLGYAFKRMDAIDPDLLRCVMQFVQPGHTVWDIGANVGLFAFAAAERAGSSGAIVAFEPDTQLVRLLRRSNDIRPASSAPTTIVPAAVGADIRIRAFDIAKRGRASNALAEYGRSETGGVAQRQFVPAFNLDWLLGQFPPPQIMKIDVEGAEVEVLRGQRQMLEQVRPIVICEVGSENRDSITAIFEAARYRLYDGGTPFNASRPIKRATWNTIAIPVENPTMLAGA